MKIGEQDDELVASHAGHGVGDAHTSTQAFGQIAQHRVAHVVAEGVVDLLESVQIHHEHTEAGSESLRAIERRPQPVIQPQAVGQSGERVVLREVAQTLFARAQSPSLPIHTMPQHGDPGQSDNNQQTHACEALQRVLRRPPGRRPQDGNVAGRAQQNVQRLIRTEPSPRLVLSGSTCTLRLR